MAHGSGTRPAPTIDPAIARYTVGSVAKALRLIDVVAAGPVAGSTLTEMGRELGASKSTTFALARTHADHAYLRTVDPGARYQLGLVFVRLGDATSNRLPLGTLARPVLRTLSELPGLTTRVAVNEGYRPVFVERVDANGAIRFYTPLGVAELAHAGAAGKVILATLPDAEVAKLVAVRGLERRTSKTITTLEGLLGDLAATRRSGYAIDDEEDVEGVFCVGAAIHDHSGACVGAVSATGIKRDLGARAIDELGQSLRAAAAEITALLRGTGNP